MNDNVTRSPFVANFLAQIDGVSAWLEAALAVAGITGVTAKRAQTRVLELKDEVIEICDLIATPLAFRPAVSKQTGYAEFDASFDFTPELAKRADEGIQNLGSAIQDDLAGIARDRKKDIEAKLPKEKQAEAPHAMQIWQQMSACDAIEEIHSTVMRLAEAARYLFQTEFLRVIVAAQAAYPEPPPTAEPTK